MNSPKCVQTWLEDRKPAQAKSSELAKLSSVQPTPLLHPSFFSLSPFSTSLRPSICLCFSTPSFPSAYPTLLGVPPLLLEGVRSSKQVNPPPSSPTLHPQPKTNSFLSTWYVSELAEEGKLFYQCTDGCFRSFFVYTPSCQKFSEFGGNGNLSPPSSLLPRKGAPGKWVFATSLPFLKIEKRNSEHAKGKHKQNSYVQ